MARIKIPTVQQQLSKLIASSSVSGTSHRWDQSNLEVAQMLDGRLESIGFAREILQVANLPGKAKLIASLGSGPGDIQQTHQAVEFLAVDRINSSAEQLKGFIKEFCLYAPNSP